MPQLTATAEEPAPVAAEKVRYPPHGGMRAELNRRVNAYFEEHGLDKGGGWIINAKALLLLTWFWTSWALAVFWAGPLWQVALCAVSTGVAMSSIGFAVMHDGNHGASSSSTFWNRIRAYTLDMVGGSSYMWSFKHNVIHHTYPNVEEVDDDIEARPFLRLAAGQPQRWAHRFQHLYWWFIYGWLPIKWHLLDDYKFLARGKINGYPIPRPRGFDLFMLFLGKLFFMSWAFVVPLAVGHSFLWVLGVYALIAMIGGVSLGTTFQLAHCVEHADFCEVPARGETLQLPWAEHQLATTVNFCHGNTLLTHFVGGLNYQIEHHLFPRVCHVHYPALQPIVREVCAEFGVQHKTNPTLWSAVRSHVRYLKRMGQPADQRVT